MISGVPAVRKLPQVLAIAVFSLRMALMVSHSAPTQRCGGRAISGSKQVDQLIRRNGGSGRSDAGFRAARSQDAQGLRKPSPVKKASSSLASMRPGNSREM